MAAFFHRIHIKRSHIFLFVGVFNTLADFICYTLLTLFVFKNPSQIAVAGVVSGTIALIIAFLTHSLITWRDRETTAITVIKFFIVTGFGMWVIRPLLLGLFVHFSFLYNFVHTLTTNLHLPFSLTFITNTGAFGFMTIVLLVYNYFTYDRFTFSNRESHKEDKSH